MISGVSPSVWQAGTSNLPITISGLGFGTSPSVSVLGNGVSLVSVGAVSDTQISATVSIASNAPNETATVQVQSNGYNGSGFQAATSGESSTAAYNVTVQAIPGPVPQIQLYGQTITTTQSVFVGQEMMLTAVVNLPQDVTFSSQTWSTPPGAAVGGYVASNSSASVILLPALTSNSSTAYPFTFYWVDSGSSRTITYSYTATNGTTNSATATFNVAAPTGPSVSVQIGHAYVVPIQNLTQVTQNGTPSLILSGCKTRREEDRTELFFKLRPRPLTGMPELTLGCSL
jgi:hypothetical protein